MICSAASMGCTIGPVSVLPDAGAIEVDSDCSFDLRTSLKSELEQVCRDTERVQGEGGIGTLYATGTSDGYLNMIVFDGDAATAEGLDIRETSVDGNVLVVIYDFQLGDTVPIVLRVDDRDPLTCNLDNRLRPAFVDACE